MRFLLVGFGIVVRLIRFGCVVFFGVSFVVGVVEMGKDFTALCRCHDGWRLLVMTVVGSIGLFMVL
jgi:hypothetical protein